MRFYKVFNYYKKFPMIKRIFITTVFIFSFLVLTGCQSVIQADDISTIKINGKSFEVEVADTPQKKSKGLSGKEELDKNKGMLFLYGKEQRPEFWMKDMSFSLDFIWIKGNEVMDLDRNIEPEEVQPPQTITPSKEVDKVLEVNSGVIEEYDINIGDRVRYSGDNSSFL